MFRRRNKTEKNTEKGDDLKMAKSTLEMVREAYEDLSYKDKRSFHQSIADRVHESIAAQENDEHDEDSKSAEDREHEALGAEHADEKRDEEDKPSDDRDTERRSDNDHEEDKSEEDPKIDGDAEEKMEPTEDPLSMVRAQLDNLTKAVKELTDRVYKGSRESEEASDSEKRELNSIAAMYNT